MSDIVARLDDLLGAVLTPQRRATIEMAKAEIKLARLAAERPNAWRLRAQQAEADNERLRAELALCRELREYDCREIAALRADNKDLNERLTDYHRVKALGREDAVKNKRLEADNVLLRQMLHKIGKHPDTPPLIKQYALGKLDKRQSEALEQKP